MPAFVKTDEDERLWNKAKGLAEEAGHTEDWAYITGIFKKMKGGKVASMHDRLTRIIRASFADADYSFRRGQDLQNSLGQLLRLLKDLTSEKPLPPELGDPLQWAFENLKDGPLLLLDRALLEYKKAVGEAEEALRKATDRAQKQTRNDLSHWKVPATLETVLLQDFSFLDPETIRRALRAATNLSNG